MSVLHLSITARSPEAMANHLATFMGGAALPFPPCPGSWIAFGAADDGTAVEVYPQGTQLRQGPDAVSFVPGAPRPVPSATHIALASPLEEDAIHKVAADAGWTSRLCARGPFDCVEVWTGEGLLIEVLTPDMAKAYRSGMTAQNWRRMFDLKDDG